MGKDWLNTPRHAASVSVAYPQGRTWSARARSMAVQLLLTVLVVWFAVTGLTAVGLHFRTHEPSTKYVLVIDSGSSGTRIYAYSWVLPSKHSAPDRLPLVQAIRPDAAAHLVPKREKKGLYNRVETQPGLDAFVGDPAGLEASALQPLLAWARAVVPAKQQAATPLFMLGTGGLRRMELRARNTLMGDVRRILAESGFRFQETWAKVISGTDEGMYGWLALNYKNGLLAQQQAAIPAAALGRHSGSTATTAIPLALRLPSSLGSLDMGGSSLELTFEVFPGSINNSKAPAAALPYTGLQNITIGDHTFYLHTHTFHHYGLNEAYDRVITLLLEQQQKDREQATALRDKNTQQEQPEKLLQPETSQVEVQQQQQQQPDSVDLQQSNQPGLNVAAPPPVPAAATFRDGDTAGAANLPVLSASTVLAQQHAQVDLAVAAAAGFRPGVGSPAQEGNVRSSSNSSSSAAEHAQHQMQADLAVAAAAGLKPELPTAAAVAHGAAVAADKAPQSSAPEIYTADLMQHHMQADLAVAAAAGLVPTQKPETDTDSTAASNNVAGTGDSSSVAVSSGNEHLDTATSNVAALAASRVGAAAAAAPQPGSSSQSFSSNHHSSSGSELSQHIASKHYDGGALQQRALHFQHRRQQQQQQRQLLLQQHRYLKPKEVMALNTFSSNIEEQASAALPSTSSTLAASWQLHWIQQTSLHLLRHLLSDPMAAVLSPSLSHNYGQGSTDNRVMSNTDVSTHASAAAPEPMTALGSSDGHISSNDATAPALPKHSSIQAPVLQGQQGSPEHIAGHGGSNATAGWPEVWHPCLHDGYAAEYERSTYGGIVPHPAKVLLRGRPDWYACLMLVDKVVNASAPCQVSHHRPHCRLGTAQPELQGTFMALTGFYVVWKFLQVSPDAPVGALLDASRDLCSQPWSWVEEHLGHNINVERYCTWGPYTVRLLRQGLHLQDKDVRIGSGDVGWPLGAALAEASKVPEMMGKPSPRNVLHAWHTGAHAPGSFSPAEIGSGHSNLKHGTAHHGSSDMAQHDQAVEGDRVQQLEGEHELTSAATAGGASLHRDVAKQHQGGHVSMGEAYTADPQHGLGGADSDAVSHVGAWQFSQRRSWAQACFGSRHHTHMVQILLVFLIVVVWLSLVVYCLPNSGLISGHTSRPGLFFLPVAFRGLHGPGKAQHILPLAVFPGQGSLSGRWNIPSPARGSTMKYVGV